MLKFAAGLILGLFLGGTATAFAVVIAGDTGYALGWDVTKDHEVICKDPYVWVENQEIECE
jgi:hypothetical protein